jgi:DNA modification methylase
MKVITVPKKKLKFNTLTEKLYGKFSLDNEQDFQLLKSIDSKGLLEPITISKDFYVISGNRRLSAINLLANISDVKVIVKDITKSQITQLMIIEHQLQRVKDSVTVAWEYEELTKLYGLKSGVKNKGKEKKKRDEVLEKNNVSISTIARVKESMYAYIDLYKCSEEVAWKYLKEQSREKKKSVNAIRNEIISKLHSKKNNDKIKGAKIYRDEWFKIYHRPNTNLKDILKDEVVDCVMTSPPYFQMRTYQEDKKYSKSKKTIEQPQLGHEKTPEEYVSNLMLSFKECIRTLKNSGSIWVNIMDSRVDGEILDIPSKVINGFNRERLKCVQRCIWVKTNPPFNNSDTFQFSEEFILHFVKDTKTYKWFNDWFGSEDEFLGKITYGDKNKNRRFKNIYIYPNPMQDGLGVASGLIETNVINNSYLVNLMKSKEMELQHNALFPMEIPMICILSTTQKGDTVMDIFNGLGTTGLIAYAHGCKYYGIEISKEYSVQTEIRLKDFLDKNPHLVQTKMKRSAKV